MVKVGIIAAQGAITEHKDAFKKTFKKTNIKGDIILIKNKKEIPTIDGLVIPGGESTTIAKYLHRTGIANEIIKKVTNENTPIMGTCAGSILLAKEIDNQNEKVKPLSLMNMSVKRNAFGRQRESFEAPVTVENFDKPYHAVFIRAPIITKTWGNCKPLAVLENKIVGAQQNNLIALVFHPELTNDLRFHKHFLNLILKQKK
ncbi:MAG TPA: pyridoxal 5'-phosphate synthase glutaminase subunit PdxT [Thermoplasmatales archaeon]|nr:pyridoxal 5'-phosphate synthase glutaminase subunit PdxT [Thermoplasmatales archaeon]